MSLKYNAIPVLTKEDIEGHTNIYGIVSDFPVLAEFLVCYSYIGQMHVARVPYTLFSSHINRFHGYKRCI